MLSKEVKSCQFKMSCSLRVKQLRLTMLQRFTVPCSVGDVLPKKSWRVHKKGKLTNCPYNCGISFGC